MVLITLRETAGIKITQVSNFAVFAPQGRHDSRINVKFGTAEGARPLRRAKFHIARGYLGIFGPKIRKLAKKFPKLHTFSPRRGESLTRFY